MAKKKNIKETLVRRSEDYKQIYVTGALGQFTSVDYRLLFYSHEPELPEKSKSIKGVSTARVCKVEIVMSSKVAKSLRDLIDRQIKEQKEKSKKTK